MRRVILLICLLSITAFTQSKRPFTFEDMMKLKRVAEPVPSPDGKWVVFTVTDVDLTANTKTPHIWIVPLASGSTNDGGRASSPVDSKERILIPDQDGSRPRWAPDGKRFAFISNKEGGSQVWIADFDPAAGKVTRTFKATSIATEADGVLWSPDGKRILFTSSVFPQCDGEPAAEAACNERMLKEKQQSKVKAIITDRLFYRHWNAYSDGRRSHLFIIGTESPLFMQVYSGPMVDWHPIDITPGDYDTPPFSLGGQDDYSFSPDGQEVAFTSNHDRVQATSTNNDIWIVSLKDEKLVAKNITADNPASDSTPLYSPDGKYIAYRAQQRPGYESDRFRLMLYDRKTGEKKNLTEDVDLWVGSFAWSPDSSLLHFSLERFGKSFLNQLSVAGGKPVPITGGHSDDDVAVIPDGKRIVFTRMSVDAPNEIFVERIGESPTEVVSEKQPGKKQWSGCSKVGDGEACESFEALTHINGSVLSQVALSPLESFWFSGAFGDKVQGFLVKPPNFDPSKKYPVKFIVHGGPEVPMGDQWSYRWNHELFAAGGYVVIFINFHGSPGYGQKFIDAINGDWGGAPFEDLMKGLDYAEQHYPFVDKDRECALGASYGGYMANWILGHTNRFKCIVSHDGMFNSTSAWGTTEELWFNEWEYKGTPYTNREMYDKWSPHLSAKNFKTPTLVVHGQLDYRLDVSEGFQLFTTLQRLGVPSKMLYFPDEGHWVLKPQNSQLWYKTVNDWVDQWTKGSSQESAVRSQ
jgi:dipeptidyl aminopeptidase/acylaminoacyl peptidase